MKMVGSEVQLEFANTLLHELDAVDIHRSFPNFKDQGVCICSFVFCGGRLLCALSLGIQ
jgi:hypothetical protein